MQDATPGGAFMSDKDRKGNDNRIWNWIGLAASFSLALLALVSVLKNPAEFIPGGFISDSHTKIWEQWWVYRSIFHEGRLPLRMDLINFPRVGSLWPSGPLLSFAGALLTPVFGLIAAYNFTLLILITISAFGMFLLAGRLTAEPSSGLVAMVGFSFCPLSLSYFLASGTAEILGIGLMPLGLYLLHRCAFEKNKALIFGSGFVLALLLASSAYVAEMAAMYMTLLGFYALFVGRQKARRYWLKKIDDRSGPDWKRPLAALIVCVALSSGPILAQYFTYHSKQSLLADRVAGFSLADGFSQFYPGSKAHYVASLTDYVLPGKAGMTEVRQTTIFLKTCYSGWVLIFLAMIGLVFRRGFLVRFFLIAALLFMFISIGPFFEVFKGVGLPKPWNPFFLLPYYLFPMFKNFMNPFQLCILVSFSMSLLAASGVAHLKSRRKRYSSLAPIAAALILCAEFILISPAPFPTPVFSVELPWPYKKIAASPGTGALVELPVYRHATLLQFREHFSYQIHHGRPIMDNITGFLPPYIEENPLLSRLVDLETPGGLKPAPANVCKGLTGLRKSGFEMMVVRFDHYRKETWPLARSVLEGCGLKLDKEKDGYLLIDLAHDVLN